MKNNFDISDFVKVTTEQSVNTELIKRFKKRRKEYGLTQKELSLRSGVSYGSIRRFESSGDISLNSLLKISSAIDCLEDFNELFKSPIIKNLKDVK
jgi:transcriptional regulator with XRE-family HTH domain